MKKVVNWIKKHKLISIIAGFILLIIILLIIFMITMTHGGVYGDRCSDYKKYEISSSTENKVKKRIKEIDEVNNIDIYTKLCTIKIIVNLKNDVDINVIKTMATDILSYYSKKQLKYYDFSLYVTSDNEESEVYPINVTRHKSAQDFAW